EALRTLLVTAAGAALGPLTAAAPSPGKARRIGFLTPRSRPTPSPHDAFSEAVVEGMRQLRGVEGRNLLVAWGYAAAEYKRLPELAADLTRTDLEVIVTYGTAAAQALKRATSSTPIVVAAAVDLVGSGLVESLRRPGGNITGLSAIGVDLSPKQAELLKAMLP